MRYVPPSRHDRRRLPGRLQQQGDVTMTEAITLRPAHSIRTDCSGASFRPPARARSCRLAGALARRRSPLSATAGHEVRCEALKSITTTGRSRAPWSRTRAFHNCLVANGSPGAASRRGRREPQHGRVPHLNRTLSSAAVGRNASSEQSSSRCGLCVCGPLPRDHRSRRRPARPPSRDGRSRTPRRA
jgi:hypothetical protein